MTQYFKVGEAGQLVVAPSSIVLEDGTTILNFNLVANEYGYKEIIEGDKPIYDNMYQELAVSYIETETAFQEVWTIVDKVSLDVHKQDRIDLFNKTCNQTILNGFESLGYHFIFDTEAQINFTQQLLMISIDSTITNISWKTEDQGIQVFTVDQFKQIISDAQAFKQATIQHYWELKQQILEANSFNDVCEIIW